MGERKVQNKYYPPEFDPAKIPRRRQTKNQQLKVRMMLPMSIRCGTCGNYMYKGTKFNSRKEDAIGETYLGIQIFRFYFKCTTCSSEITYKTDPRNSDYIVESGASRNFEPWRAEDEVTEAERKRRDEEEMGDVMKSLESRRLDLKREIGRDAALDELKSMKRVREGVSVDAMLEALGKRGLNEAKGRLELEEEDEAIVKSVVFKKGRRQRDEHEAADCRVIRRTYDNDISLKRRKASGDQQPSNPRDYTLAKSGHAYKFIFKSSTNRVLPVVKTEKQQDPSSKSAATTGGNGILKSLWEQYGSDDVGEDDDK